MLHTLVIPNRAESPVRNLLLFEAAMARHSPESAIQNPE
jgi:hypothetical protein